MQTNNDDQGPADMDIVVKLEAAVTRAKPGSKIDPEPFGYDDPILGWMFGDVLKACHELVRRGLPLIPDHESNASDFGDNLTITIASTVDELEQYRAGLQREIQELQRLIDGVVKAQNGLNEAA